MVDLSGSTLVYASRTNPHPYKYDRDIAFDLAEQKNKIIVISVNVLVPKVKRSTNVGLKQIYVSVTSDTDSASFAIEANTCDPSNCTEGTNEIPRTTQPPTAQPTTVELSTHATNETAPISSARVVSATKFMVVFPIILKIFLETAYFI